jgi:hypothetical protein
MSDKSISEMESDSGESAPGLSLLRLGEAGVNMVEVQYQ